MKSPFVIQYKATLENRYNDISDKTVLNEFNYRFKKLHADNIYFIKESKLSVKNELIRFPPDLNFNYWTGIGKAEINIIKKEKNDYRLIIYRFYFTRIFIGFLILFSFLLISLSIIDFPLERKIEISALPVIILIVLYIISFSIVLIRHKTVFNGVIRTIKNGLQQKK